MAELHSPIIDPSSQPSPEPALSSPSPETPPPPTPAAIERPQELPEEFWDPQKGAVKLPELIKAWSDLKTKTDAAGIEPPDRSPERSGLDGKIPEPKTEEQVLDVIQKAGLDLNTLSQKIIQSGDLEKTDYEALARYGLPQPIVTNYIAGIKAQAVLRYQNMCEAVNGKEQLTTILNWASTHLSAPEREAINEQLEKEHGWKTALMGLQAMYHAKVGFRGTPMYSGAAVAPDFQSGIFKNNMELLAARADKRYRERLPHGVPNPDFDPEYKSSVDQKLLRSKNLLGSS